MILSDKTIEDHLKYSHFEDAIEITPEPDDEQIQPASLDVRLGEEVYHVEEDSREIRVHHKLLPGERYLGHTKETIDLPNHIAGQLAGRSSVGRRGVIVHKTAGWLDPGFRGDVVLELMNLGNEPVVLEEGERIAQIVFLELDRPSRGYDGGYQGQTGATEAYQE